MQIIINFFKYFYVSLIGLSLDITVYYILVHVFDIKIFSANLISSFCAISFVYVMSTKKIFNKQSSVSSYTIYIIYHTISINIYSYLVSYIHCQYEFSPLISKSMTIPISFMTNFLFMILLIKQLHKGEEYEENFK